MGARKVGMRPLIINRFGRLGVEEITDCPILSSLEEVFAHL